MHDWQSLNQKQRKHAIRQIEKEELDIVHPDAAGIDVGNASHFVAVSSARDPQPVRQFGCFTEDLIRMAEWLRRCGIRTVAMQSTGVYWIPLYDILQGFDIDVFLVNAKHTRNLPGRKTDWLECQWMLKLHTFGFLRNSFRPPSQILAMRTIWRLRNDHIRGASQQIQRIQKILTEMNVQLANVISDVSGVSGMAIIRAILAGQRDPHQLAALCDHRIRATTEQIVRSLQGNWRPDLLFALEQHVQHYDLYQRMIGVCDRQLQSHIQTLPSNEVDQSESAGQPSAAKLRNKRYGKPQRNAPHFNLAEELKRYLGVDLTLIDGIDVMTAQTIASEIGRDLSPWKSEKHFASWLGLCPDNRISGGKVLGRATRRVEHPITCALRMSAFTLLRSKSYLGAKYRTLRTRLGAPKAITAMAHHLARLIYRLLKYGHAYIDKGADFYESKYADNQIRNLTKKAAKFGFELIRTLPGPPQMGQHLMN